MPATGAVKVPCPEGFEIRIIAVISTGAPAGGNAVMTVAQPGAADVYHSTGTLPGTVTRVVFGVGMAYMNDPATLGTEIVATVPIIDVWWPYQVTVGLLTWTISNAVVLYQVRKRQ